MMPETYRKVLARQLARAVATGDRAAEIMLRARLRPTCSVCGSRTHVLCNRTAPPSELEMRYLHGDR